MGAGHAHGRWAYRRWLLIGFGSAATAGGVILTILGNLESLGEPLVEEGQIAGPVLIGGGLALLGGGIALFVLSGTTYEFS
jgi:hypothetical protein